MAAKSGNSGKSNKKIGILITKIKTPKTIHTKLTKYIDGDDLSRDSH